MVGIQDTVDSIATDLATSLTSFAAANPTTVFAQYTYTASGNTLTITANADGTYDGTAGNSSVPVVPSWGTGITLTETPAVDAVVVSEGAVLQIGANANQQLEILINDMRALALGVSSISDTDTDFADTALSDDSGATEYALDITTADGAGNAIDVIDDALESVSSERARLGAYQNRLEHTINNLSTTSENLSAAESRIRDVDMAQEMVEFTKNNILAQAAQSMLAQANQQPQNVLQLLQ